MAKYQLITFTNQVVDGKACTVIYHVPEGIDVVDRSDASADAVMVTQVFEDGRIMTICDGAILSFDMR